MVLLMICTFLIPVIQVIAGWMMRYHTPKQISSWIGYRTMRSTKNEAAWFFANRYCGKLWLTAGVGMLALTAVACGCSLLLSRKAADMVSLVMIGVQTLEILLTIPFVENALKQNERGDTHAQN